jgi:hypothetical protein
MSSATDEVAAPPYIRAARGLVSVKQLDRAADNWSTSRERRHRYTAGTWRYSYATVATAAAGQEP